MLRQPFQFLAIATFLPPQGQEKYGDKPIEVRIINLDAEKKKFAELVENVQRHDLPWQDVARAIVGVDRFGRRIFGEHTPGGSPQKHSSNFDKWDEQKTAELLNIPQSTVSEAQTIVEIAENHPEVLEKKRDGLPFN